MREQKENDYRERLLDGEYEDNDSAEESSETVLEIKSDRSLILSGLTFFNHRSLQKAAQKEPYKSILVNYSIDQIRILEATFMRHIADPESNPESEDPDNLTFTFSGPAYISCCLCILAFIAGIVMFILPVEGVIENRNMRISKFSLVGSGAFFCLFSMIYHQCLLRNRNSLVEPYAPRFLSNQILTDRTRKILGIFANKTNNHLVMPIGVTSLILSYL